MESKIAKNQLNLHNHSVDSVSKNLSTPFQKLLDSNTTRSHAETIKHRNKSNENKNLPGIQNPKNKGDYLYLNPSKQNEQIAQVLFNIIQNENNNTRDKSSIITKTGMKNWFKNENPNEFARTQANYVKQIDAYLKSQTSPRRRAYYGKGRSEIMKKIEKGYALDENALKVISGKQKNSSFGTTTLYNNYVIKLLSNFNDPYIKSKYDQHLNILNKKKSQTASNVYSRMSIDVKRRESVVPSSFVNLHLQMSTGNSSLFS